jgi:hypothetical protein
VNPGRKEGRKIAPPLLWAACLVLMVILSGCVSPPLAPAQAPPPFRFGNDTFAFANELRWEYQLDWDTGRMRHRRNDPPPTYTLHCFVLARSMVQFRQNARFAPEQPPVSDIAYRHLVRAVVGRNPRRPLPRNERVVIPGFADLGEFSAAKPALLRDNCGDWWQSYVQRGHWRMTWAFTKRHQRRMATNFVREVEAGKLPIVHLVRFPRLSINHAVVIYGSQEDGAKITFRIYDPNRPQQPGELIFDRTKGRFQYPATHYFAGGRVDVYQVYHAWNF